MTSREAPATTTTTLLLMPRTAQLMPQTLLAAQTQQQAAQTARTQQTAWTQQAARTQQTAWTQHSQLQLHLHGRRGMRQSGIRQGPIPQSEPSYCAEIEWRTEALRAQGRGKGAWIAPRTRPTHGRGTRRTDTRRDCGRWRSVLHRGRQWRPQMLAPPHLTALCH